MKRLILILSLLLSINLLLIIFLFNEKKEFKCDKEHVNEWTPSRDPETGADSSLIEQLNFFIVENVRLETYVKLLEEENQILGSTLAEKEFNDN